MMRKIFIISFEWQYYPQQIIEFLLFAFFSSYSISLSFEKKLD